VFLVPQLCLSLRAINHESNPATIALIRAFPLLVVPGDRMRTDQLVELATQRLRAGDLAEARRLYQEALTTEPNHPVALVRSGLLEMQEGKPQEAVTRIEKAIAAAPGESRYPFVLGEVLASMQRWPDAAAAYRRSLAIQPQAADVCLALGTALQTSGDFKGAIEAYQTAVRSQPDLADAFNNLGNCHQVLGDLAAAQDAYRRAMELKPDFAGAMANLGTVLKGTGRADEAIGLLRAAVSLEPEVTGHAVNLGAALCQQRKFADAETILRTVVQRNGNDADAAYNLGNALAGLGKLRDAVVQYLRAMRLRPDFADALNNLGNVYKELGEFNLAGEAYAAAIGAQPDLLAAINNSGCLLRTMGRLEEAETVFRRGLDINANHSALHNNLGNVLKDLGELEEAIACFGKAVALNSANAEAHSNLVYALSFQATTAEPILRECLRWNQRHAAPLQTEIPARGKNFSPDRRLRIGYVSPDFRDHCQSLFAIPLLSHHDHEAFEIYCYSSVERPDEYTGRIAGYADAWREVRPLDDAAMCDLIRADGIDILVDLTMHMANGRPLVFARKPAPIQIAWLAYPGTTGISAMDYRLSDPRLDPPGFEKHYSERTIRLPDSFWCYDPLCDGPEVSPLPAISRGYVTFGCLNNPCKLSDQTLGMWGGVMRAIPKSRLVLLAPLGSHRERLLARLGAQGIAADRVDFVPHRPRDQYLRSYHEIDIGLDTFPYNGHTTSLDSLWMGVPVVTRVGQTCVGRGGLSQLFQLELLELAGENDAAFVDAAAAMVSDLARLATLRQGLRRRLEFSPLMDAGRFARNLERVYRSVCQP
jgi:predicted O-linked N-acetylglucosamine transferase (SPINDLY family)